MTLNQHLMITHRWYNMRKMWSVPIVLSRLDVIVCSWCLGWGRTKASLGVQQASSAVCVWQRGCGVWRYVNSTLTHKGHKYENNHTSRGTWARYTYSTESSECGTVLFSFNSEAGMWHTMVRQAEPALKCYRIQKCIHGSATWLSSIFPLLQESPFVL